jgi:hypothetical protein
VICDSHHRSEHSRNVVGSPGLVEISVNGGSGKVTAYASVIDILTNDPTYVPAQ